MSNTQIESEFQEALRNCTKAKIQHVLNMMKKQRILSIRASKSPGSQTEAEDDAHGTPDWEKMMQYNKIELAKQETKIKKFIHDNRMERVRAKLEKAVDAALEEDHDLIDRINSDRFNKLYEQSEKEYDDALEVLQNKTRNYKKGLQFRIEQEVQDTDEFIKEYDKKNSPIRNDIIDYTNKTSVMKYDKLKSHRCLAHRKTDKKLLCQNITLSKHCHWHVLS